MATRLTGFLLLLLPALSQAATSTSEPVLEELIVTAERVERNVQDTSIAITSINESTIRDFGMVGPDEFIPLAEELGLVGAIGDWVLRTACAQGRIWQRAGRPIRIGVNVSSQQVHKPGLVQRVHNELFQSPDPAYKSFTVSPAGASSGCSSRAGAS